MELVGPKNRVIIGTLASSCYALGEIFIGLVAWLTQSWRTMLLIIYMPAILVFSYLWLAPESIRWLLTQEREDEALEILKKASKVNRKPISDEGLNLLLAPKKTSNERKYPIVKVFKSRTLVLRFMNSCFCWITCTFLFYGITLHSVSLSSNPYLDFILSALVEVPAYFVTYISMNNVGRRFSLSSSFLLTGVACLTVIFIPHGKPLSKICLFVSPFFCDIFYLFLSSFLME